MERGEEGGPRPSSRSVERYAQGVRGEVGDLRAALRAALDEAEQHEAEGRPDLAVAALERQRAAVAQVHARLEQLTASAAVEREAEHVLRGASAQQPTASGADAGAAGPAGPVRRRRGLVAVVAGTLATAVAGAAVALTGGVADRGPSDPTVVAVAPVEVDDAPAPPATATPDTGATTSGGDADGGHTPARADDGDRGRDAPTGADRGEQDTPRRGLDALVAQVVESLAALLGDGAERDAPDVPATDELDERVPAVPEVPSSREDDGDGAGLGSGQDDDGGDERDLDDLR